MYPASTSSFIDPSAFTMSHPSPASGSHSSGSPAPSLSFDDDAHADGPSRKRSRTEHNPDARKEARAHRNRIAAQNSRDKRKAQFSALQQRVDELEAENRALRAGAHFPPSPTASSAHPAREAWELENAELKERIKTLETGWNAILKALEVQGLARGLPGPTPATAPAPTSAPAPLSPPKSEQSSDGTASFPVLVSPSPVFTLTPTPSSISSPRLAAPSEPLGSARHLARVASAVAPATASLQRADPQVTMTVSAITAVEQAWTRTIGRMYPQTMTRRWRPSSVRSSRHPLSLRRRVSPLPAKGTPLCRLRRPALRKQ